MNFWALRRLRLLIVRARPCTPRHQIGDTKADDTAERIGPGLRQGRCLPVGRQQDPHWMGFSWKERCLPDLASLTICFNAYDYFHGQTRQTTGNSTG